MAIVDFARRMGIDPSKLLKSIISETEPNSTNFLNDLDDETLEKLLQIHKSSMELIDKEISKLKK